MQSFFGFLRSRDWLFRLGGPPKKDRLALYYITILFLNSMNILVVRKWDDLCSTCLSQVAAAAGGSRRFNGTRATATHPDERMI